MNASHYACGQLLAIRKLKKTNQIQTKQKKNFAPCIPLQKFSDQDQYGKRQKMLIRDDKRKHAATCRPDEILIGTKALHHPVGWAADRMKQPNKLTL